MAFSDPLLEARRKSIIAGTSNQQAPTISQPTKTTGFVDPSFEAKRKQVFASQGTSRAELPPLTPIQTQPVQQTKASLLDKASKFFGISTGELSAVGGKIKDYVSTIPQNITNTPQYLSNLGKNTLNKIKDVIAQESEKQKVYKIDNNIPDYQALDYDQIRDYSSIGFLNTVKEDFETDLKKLQSKQNKNSIDNYRIKNIQGTVDQINETLVLPPEERRKKEALINGLALGRISSNLAAGFLGAFEGVADFIQWRADKAEMGSTSKFSESTANKLNEWAKEVAPNNPNLSDEILQGTGSTLAFYIPGAGVASATSRLATISPKIATLFGVTASATMEAATESGNTYVNMLDSGLPREEADLAASRVFAGNVIYNMISDKVGLFGDSEGLKRMFTTALAEGSQEAFQDGLQAVAQKKELDPNQLAKTFFIGAIVGGGLGSVIQNASVSENINEDDKKKLADFAEKIRKVENGEDPEMLGFEFVNNEKPKANFVDPKVYAESIGGKVGDIKNVNDLEIPEYSKGQISQQQVNIVKEQIRNGDKIDPVVVDAQGNVLDGAHKLTAFKEMGVQDIATVVREEAGAKKEQFDYSSTQLDLPADTASKITEFANSIPENDLYKDPQANYGAQVTGRENEPHITVLYGLNTTNQNEVRNLVEAEKPIEVKMGKVSAFETDDKYDVLKVDVVSDQLASLNAKLDKALETPGKTFDEYKPHVTIAYVKKGEGAKYVGDSRFEGQTIKLNELTFSNKTGEKVTIPFAGKTAEKQVSDEVIQSKKDVKTEDKAPQMVADTEELLKIVDGGGFRTAEEIDKLKRDIIANGIKFPIELIEKADGSFVINDGNHRIQIAKDLGIKEIPVEIVRSEKKSTTKKLAKSRLKEYPSVYAGLASKGAEKIHNFELRKPPVKGTEEFKLHKKIVGLIRKYAQSIGEGYTPRNALGVYFAKTKNIRINNTNNVTVAAHEIAHFLDYANGITDKLLAAKDGPIKNQIEKIYQQYYPTARPNHEARLQALEGFATLLQKYTEQPTTITQEYPDLVKEFLTPEGKYYVPVMGEIVKDLNQMIGEYQDLAALDKIGARVTSEGTNVDKPSFLNFWQKFRTQIADQVYPVEVLAQKGKVAFTKEDPSLWVRAYNAVSGIINNNISTDRGYWSFTDLQNGWQKKYDFNWKSLVESTQRRGITDSFSNFLVARREYYMYQELDQLQVKKDVIDKIAKAFDSVKADGMAKFDRDMKTTLSEDFGIDLNEISSIEQAKAGIKALQERFTQAYDEQKEILDNDNFKREDIDEAYKENKERFKDEETMFDALTREDLNLLYNKDVQLIDAKTYSQLKNQEGYASFKRQFYDEIVGDNDAPGSVRVGTTKVSSLIGRKGSERTIINPLYSALSNHSEIVRKAMKQVVYNQIGKLGTSALMPNLMQVVPIKTAKQGDKIIFTQEKDPNIIMARENYKRLPILMDGQVKSIIDSVLTHQNIDTFTQLYTGLSRMFTAGTTGLYPSFAITNFMVDQITATANSYNKFKGLYSPMKEMLKVIREKGGPEAKFYEEYLIMGGERQTFTGWQKLEPNDLFKRINEEKTKMQKAISAMQKGIDILSIPSAKSEIFTRATEYINARKAGKSQIVSLEEAGRVSAPFHHMGTWGAKEGQKSMGQIYVRGLPFFNASIQVLDQAVRVASTKEGAKRMMLVTTAITAAYLASILAMMDASDDQKEQYKDLEANDLANFIYLPNPSGNGLIRVKMSNSFSIPGTVMNMIIANKMFFTRYGAKDIMQAATAFLPSQLNPTDPVAAILGWIPQVFKPVTHVIFNVKEYPTVSSLVSMGLQRKPAALQYNEGTSLFAKKLGEVLNISPIKVDYLLTGYFGRASGFLTGKPGIYNPATSIMRDYYFTSGKRVREFYDLKESNDGEYTAYQNLEKGFENLPKDKVNEIYRIKATTDKIDELLGEYRDIDPKVDQQKAFELRTKILLNIENLNTGAKPSNFGKWSFDASKRRSKNKVDKK